MKNNINIDKMVEKINRKLEKQEIKDNKRRDREDKRVVSLEEI